MATEDTASAGCPSGTCGPPAAGGTQNAAHKQHRVILEVVHSWRSPAQPPCRRARHLGVCGEGKSPRSPRDQGLRPGSHPGHRASLAANSGADMVTRSPSLCPVGDTESHWPQEQIRSPTESGHPHGCCGHCPRSIQQPVLSPAVSPLQAPKGQVGQAWTGTQQREQTSQEPPPCTSPPLGSYCNLKCPT